MVIKQVSYLCHCEVGKAFQESLKSSDRYQPSYFESLERSISLLDHGADIGATDINQDCVSAWTSEIRGRSTPRKCNVTGRPLFASP